jgi:hypothetical protein
MEILELLAQNKELGPVLMSLIFAAGVSLGVYRIVSKSSLAQRTYDLNLQKTIRDEMKAEYGTALTTLRQDNAAEINRLESVHSAEIERVEDRHKQELSDMQTRLLRLENRFEALKTPLLRINQLVARLPQTDPAVVELSREIQSELREALENA